MTVKEQGKPYTPSWVDRFTAWVEKLPMPWWLFYVSLGFGLILIQVLFLWVDGGQVAAGLLLPIIIFNAVLNPFALALIYVLDHQAVVALDTMKPSLRMIEQEFSGFRYRLANMPAGPALITGLLLMVFAILMERLWVEPVRFAALETLPLFSIVFHIIDKIPAFLLGVLTYHTVRQLHLVNTINSNYVRISLFNLRPSQSFSKLTASTAVGLMVGIYGWMLINPDLLGDPVSLGFVGLFTLLGVGVFVWPMWGIHRLIDSEKAKALSEIDQDFEQVFTKFNQLLQDKDYTMSEGLNGTMAGLVTMRRRISEIPTWPWRAETARFALSAIVIPMVLAILQFIVLRLLDQ
jgi:hypothetical protein